MNFVFDLDGTICFKGQPLTQEICAALDESQAMGHEIIFASARPIRDLLPVLPEKYHHFRMVGGNGAFRTVGGSIEVNSFDTGTCQQLFNIIDTYQISYLIDSSWDYSYTGELTHPIYKNIDPLKNAKNIPIDLLENIVKVVLFTSNPEIQRSLEALSLTLHLHQNEGILDLSPQGIDKWAGLQQIGVKEKEFIAFGNDSNDICMFKAAKESICIGNHPIAQEAASLQVASDDVAKMILHMSEKYLAQEIEVI
ncbi:HAD family hydrolase [Paenisporosarcina quisquiliarum]|uniref:HAD family hydrolase n=1 Tax=Paenisporosarcina quisquiliarum TaxID=365346 RepID=A0A9X3LHW4_9BACL|nr:HAD-IIB family hydrolase [Paenisporosarcina quisquiliarum]MCZ8538325.1 HAD family hydrolase [Paenisporosarcina quisquiliarum]